MSTVIIASTSENLPVGRESPRQEGVVMSEANADRNLLFGVLALQIDAISRIQFVDACTL